MDSKYNTSVYFYVSEIVKLVDYSEFAEQNSCKQIHAHCDKAFIHDIPKK